MQRTLARGAGPKRRAGPGCPSGGSRRAPTAGLRARSGSAPTRGQPRLGFGLTSHNAAGLSPHAGRWPSCGCCAEPRVCGAAGGGAAAAAAVPARCLLRAAAPARGAPSRASESSPPGAVRGKGALPDIPLWGVKSFLSCANRSLKLPKFRDGATSCARRHLFQNSFVCVPFSLSLQTAGLWKPDWGSLWGVISSPWFIPVSCVWTQTLGWG